MAALDPGWRRLTNTRHHITGGGLPGAAHVRRAMAAAAAATASSGLHATGAYIDEDLCLDGDAGGLPAQRPLRGLTFAVKDLYDVSRSEGGTEGTPANTGAAMGRSCPVFFQ